MKTIIEFIKKKKMLNIIFFIAFTVVITYELFKGYPELFPYGGIIYKLLAQLGLSYVSSFIFYIILVYIPEYRDKKYADRYVERKILTICVSHDFELEKLYEFAEVKKEEGELKVKDFELLLKQVVNSKKTQFSSPLKNWFVLEMKNNPDTGKSITNHRYTYTSSRWNEYLSNNIKHYKEDIEKILRYIQFLDSDLLNILYALEVSRYFELEDYIREVHKESDVNRYFYIPQAYFEHHKLINDLRIKIGKHG